jgi:hypothetical protein
MENSASRQPAPEDIALSSVKIDLCRLVPPGGPARHRKLNPMNTDHAKPIAAITNRYRDIGSGCSMVWFFHQRSTKRAGHNRRHAT